MTDSLWRKRQEPEAMTLALEALKNTTPTGFNMESDKKFFAAIKALEEALAKQEQGEPVAYLTKRKLGGTEGLLRADMVDRSAKNQETHYFIPLYTTPQHRTWVGLTAEDRWEIVYATERDDRTTVMQLVEAKLRSKNDTY
jgi:hypothetical protein